MFTRLWQTDESQKMMDEIDHSELGRVIEKYSDVFYT